MTYKAAAAGMPWGGGKAVIWADASSVDRAKLFRAHGRAVERLGGRYITSVDIGTGPDDMRYVQEETTHVAGLPKPFGDPSPATAHGVQRAIEAAVKHVWGRPDLSGRSIAIQGCGHVGYHLARGLRKAGARLVVTDATADRANRVAREFGAQVVAPNEIESAKVDVFAPCAFGGGLSARTIPTLHCQVVAGAANNQLLTDSRRRADRKTRGRVRTRFHCQRRRSDLPGTGSTRLERRPSHGQARRHLRHALGSLPARQRAAHSVERGRREDCQAATRRCRALRCRALHPVDPRQERQGASRETESRQGEARQGSQATSREIEGEGEAQIRANPAPHACVCAASGNVPSRTSLPNACTALRTAAAS